MVCDGGDSCNCAPYAFLNGGDIRCVIANRDGHIVFNKDAPATTDWIFVTHTVHGIWIMATNLCAHNGGIHIRLTNDVAKQLYCKIHERNT